MCHTLQNFAPEKSKPPSLSPTANVPVNLRFTSKQAGASADDAQALAFH
jgi:hypothetical protein